LAYSSLITIYIRLLQVNNVPRRVQEELRRRVAELTDEDYTLTKNLPPAPASMGFLNS
jgi:hypothetical protein